MRFKPGDLVIKISGGNKMRVVDYIDDVTVDCIWATEDIHEANFNENDLVPISEYKLMLITEQRDDLIDNILNEKRDF